MRKALVRTFSIHPALLHELEKMAAKEDRNVSEILREAIREYLKGRRRDEFNLQVLSGQRALAASVPVAEQRTSVAAHARRAAGIEQRER